MTRTHGQSEPDLLRPTDLAGRDPILRFIARRCLSPLVFGAGLSLLLTGSDLQLDDRCAQPDVYPRLGLRQRLRYHAEGPERLPLRDEEDYVDAHQASDWLGSCRRNGTQAVVERRQRTVRYL